MAASVFAFRGRNEIPLRVRDEALCGFCNPASNLEHLMSHPQTHRRIRLLSVLVVMILLSPRAMGVPLKLMTSNSVDEIAKLEETAVLVRDAASLRAALPGLAAGMILRLIPGEYPGGNAVEDVPDLTIEAADPDQPPHFEGKNNKDMHCSVQRQMKCAAQNKVSIR